MPNSHFSRVKPVDELIPTPEHLSSSQPAAADDFFSPAMANKSLRKKSEKRPANSSPTNLSTSPSRPSARSFARYKMAVLLISAVAFAFALIFLSISSNMGSVVGVEPSIDRIYDVTVVNEFPHDPNAFTQVCSV